MRKVFAIMFFLAVLAISLASATDIYVCSTAGCDPYIGTGNITAALTNSNNTDNTIIINQSGTYTLNSTTTFNITDAGANGTVVFSADNILFDCNGSTIDGYTYTGYGLNINNSDNVSVINCNLKDYITNYYVNTSTNISLNNSNSSYAGNYGYYFTSSVNSRMNRDQSAYDDYGIYAEYSNYSIILDCIINKTNTTGVTISTLTSLTMNNTNITYVNNTGLSMSLTNNSIFGNNIIDNVSTGVLITFNSTNNTLNNIKIYDASSYGMLFATDGKVRQTNIINSLINNSASGLAVLDSWDLQINDTNITYSPGHAMNINNLNSSLFYNDRIYDADGYGIILTSSHNNNISGLVINTTDYDGIQLLRSNSNIILNSYIDNGGISDYSGIALINSTGNTINNTNITSSAYVGLFMYYSNLTVANNNFINNSGTYGLYIEDSKNNQFVDNIINNSGDARKIVLIGALIQDCTQNFSGTGNKIDGDIIEFFVNMNDYTITDTPSYLGIVNSNNISLNDKEITGTYERAVVLCNVTNSSITNVNITQGPIIGIEVFQSSHINITNCNINSTDNHGIYLYKSNFSTLTSNTLSSNTVNGLYLINAFNNTIIDNTFTTNIEKAINLQESNGCLLDHNTFNQNILGELLVNSSNATKIFNNTLTNTNANSDAIGIYSYGSTGLTVYNNNVSTYKREGLKLESSTTANITSNNFLVVKNITLTGSSSNYIIGNLINNSNASGLVLISSSGSNTVQDNTIRYSGVDGITVSSSLTNTFINNTVTNNTGDGLKITSSTGNIIKNNTFNYNTDNGVELLNVSTSNMSYNYVKFNAIGLSLARVGSSACSGNNISKNDLTNNTDYDLENLQVGTAVTAEDNYWGSTWAYYVDTNIYDYNEEPLVGEADFCPLLDATFLTGVSTSCAYPNVTLKKTHSSIAANNFSINGTAVDSYFSNCTYKIANTSDSSVVWANGSFNTTNKNFSADYEGIYLPAGNWNFSATCYDQFNNNYTSSDSISSSNAILPTIIGTGTGSGTIGGSDITFVFNIKSKTYPYVRFFMNLTSGINTYDNTFAHIGNSTTQVNISNSTDYTGATTFNLSAISAGSLPSYVRVYSGIYEKNVTLYLTPYSGLSAGTYTGAYGWGLFDS